MSEHEPFVDHYKILEVNPNCSPRVLESAYHRQAKRYHPDHADEADVAKLTEVIDAYRALKDPAKRAEYNAAYSSHTGFIFTGEDFGLEEDVTAVSDADDHAKILLALYKRRRDKAQDAGVAPYYLQELLNCSDDALDFHIWYLREKDLIAVTEQGTLAITVNGIDHVISTSRTAMREREKLMLSQLD
jgi:curved DNA-binding protein